MNGIKPKPMNNGVSLIELMITVAVIGIISAIAIPMYTDYLDTAREGVMRNNIESIRLFEEDLKLSMGAYIAGTYDPNDADDVSGATGLKNSLGWEPRTTENKIKYDVDNVTTNGFRITATDIVDGKVVVVSYP